MENIILMTITKEELGEEIKSAFSSLINKKKFNYIPKVYTINRVSKILGLSFATVKKLVSGGMIETTKSGLISEDALNDYLQR